MTLKDVIWSILEDATIFLKGYEVTEVNTKSRQNAYAM